MKNSRKTLQAFTLIELLTIVAVFMLLAALVSPALARTKAADQRIGCANNLKQIGLAFQSWAVSHGDAFPMTVGVSKGGYADYLGMRLVTDNQATSRGVFGVFLAMSNELSTPKILSCPAENEIRQPATTFSGTNPSGTTNSVPFVNDLNTSYFTGVDASSSTPQAFLCGDHNLGADGNLVPHIGFVTPPVTYSPLFAVSLGTNFMPNAGVGWLNTMHAKQGNVLLADCSVQQLDRTHLQQALQIASQPGALSGPSFPVPPGCLGAGLNRIQFP